MLAPVVQRAAFAFNTLAPDAFVMVITSTNQLGLANLQDDGPDFALSDVSARELLGSDAESLSETVIAAVPYAVIVNAGVGVTAVRRDQVRGLYAGSITRWSQIGGTDVPVMPLQSSKGTGLRYLFHRVFMQQPGELDHTPDINYLASSNPVLDVSRNRGALAYAPLIGLTSGVRALTIDGVIPSVDAVAAGALSVLDLCADLYKAPAGRAAARVHQLPAQRRRAERHRARHGLRAAGPDEGSAAAMTPPTAPSADAPSSGSATTPPRMRRRMRMLVILRRRRMSLGFKLVIPSLLGMIMLLALGATVGLAFLSVSTEARLEIVENARSADAARLQIETRSLMDTAQSALNNDDPARPGPPVPAAEPPARRHHRRAPGISPACPPRIRPASTR